MLSLSDENLGSTDLRVNASERGSQPTPASLLGLVAILLRRRRTILFVPLALTAIAVAIAFAIPKKFTTTVSFVPVRSSLPTGALAGLAGQLGVSLTGSDPSASPDFYSDLLQTRDILERVVTNEYIVSAENSRPQTFVEYYDITSSDSGKRLDKAIRFLDEEVLSIGFNRQTSIVTLKVRTTSPELSFQIAEFVMSLVDEFNLSSRRSQGSADQRFLEVRLDTARAELRRAENSLQSFLVRNRSYQNDPSLTFEYQRLQRDVGLRQDVYGVLTQSYEQARLTAVRTTPSIAFVQPPRVPLRHDSRRILVITLGVFCAGFGLSIFYVLASNAIDEAKSTDPGNWAVVTALWREMVARVRHGKPVASSHGASPSA